MKKLNIKAAVMDAAANGAGAVAAVSLNKIGFIQKQKPLVRGLIKVAAGAFLPKLLGKGKSGALLDNVGKGMMAIGVVEIANDTVFKNNPVSISGVGTLPTIGEVDPGTLITENYVSGTLPTVGSDAAVLGI